MKILSAVGIGLVSLLPSYGYAQQFEPGKYVGEFVVTSSFPGKERAVRLELVFESAKEGLVKGVGKSQSPSCRGAEVPFVGKLQGNKLELRSAEERTSCTMQYSLTVDGNKLVGTTRSGYPVQLTKQ